MAEKYLNISYIENYHVANINFPRIWIECYKPSSKMILKPGLLGETVDSKVGAEKAQVDSRTSCGLRK